MVEHRSPKPAVAGSSPARPVTFEVIEESMAKAVNFFKDCARELKLVVWPTREQVWSRVQVVVVSTIIISILLGALDLGFTALFRLLMK